MNSRIPNCLKSQPPWYTRLLGFMKTGFSSKCPQALCQQLEAEPIKRDCAGAARRAGDLHKDAPKASNSYGLN